MSRTTRQALITALESERKSRVIAMFMGDRPGIETKIAQDIVPIVARHLREIGRTERIDLVLYTLGGDVMAGFRLVHLIREYCSADFNVIVPFRCQSTGTLIALGADHIIMLPEGQLSPVDPSTNGPYNPMIPGMPIQPGAPLPVLPVSVEEVVSFIQLAKEVGELKGEESLARVFEKLTSDVRPLALGQVYRARTQIRMLSRKLLQTHMQIEDPAIDTIVETLTEKLYSHDYLISRREAKTFGLKVLEAEVAVETAVSAIYDEYEKDLELRQSFNPMTFLAAGQQARRTSGGAPQQAPVKVTLDRALVESTGRADVFRTELTLQAVPQGVHSVPQFEGWKVL